MAISSLDTLDIARRLKGAGFNDAQAETVTEIFRDVREADLANLATKTDIERLEAATKSDFERLEAATKSDFERLEDKLEILRRDMTIRLGGMIVAPTAVLLAAKFLG
jgi:adenine-specific DNA methylase